MPYDIVDAHEDILVLNEKLDALIQLLKEKKIIEEEKKEDGKK